MSQLPTCYRCGKQPRTRQNGVMETEPKYPLRIHDNPGLTQPQCAKLLGISVRAVQDREYRALRKLRAAIMDDARLHEALLLEM